MSFLNKLRFCGTIKMWAGWYDNACLSVWEASSESSRNVFFFTPNRVVIYCNGHVTLGLGDPREELTLWPKSSTASRSAQITRRPSRRGTFLGHVGQVAEARRREKNGLTGPQRWPNRRFKPQSLSLSTLCVSLTVCFRFNCVTWNHSGFYYGSLFVCDLTDDLLWIHLEVVYVCVWYLDNYTQWAPVLEQMWGRLPASVFILSVGIFSCVWPSGNDCHYSKAASQGSHG